jgi:hypothetical protein
LDSRASTRRNEVLFCSTRENSHVTDYRNLSILEAKNNAAAVDVEVPGINADAGMRVDSEPVFELTHPSSSGPVLSNVTNHENEAIFDLNASKKGRRSGDSQEG